MIIKREDILKKAPSTRYQGSKRSILPWLYETFRKLEFNTVLDGFGGTATVSYLFKLMRKKVTFNDQLFSNYMAGIALIENQRIVLDDDDVGFILNKNGFDYPSFIADTFKGIYYLPRENRWLDMVSFNIRMLSEKYNGDVLRKKQALAYHTFFQACLSKRPFNLFHRKNLYLRTANVERSFGNKKTWNTSFQRLFLRFNKEFSQKIFSTKLKHKAICEDIMRVRKKTFDLVYLDPPYARKNKKHPKDYHSLYHFFEGMLDYDNWARKINWDTKNRCLVREKTGWDEGSIEENFDKLFRKYQNSIIVVSYGSPGAPSINTIRKLLKKYKSKVYFKRKPYCYKLNNKNGGLYEVLLIGK